jgi:hypothetical protein
MDKGLVSTLLLKFKPPKFPTLGHFQSSKKVTTKVIKRLMKQEYKY